MRRAIAVALTLAMLAGCVGPGSRAVPAAPPDSYEKALVAGYQSDIRVFGDSAGSGLPGDPMGRAAIRRMADRRLDVLALSGGSDGGAYGAGVLTGWTKRGDRPEFTVVTGVSTGALIAPMAFLGSAYDERLEYFYTQTSADDILIFRPLSVLFGATAVGDSTPLRGLIENTVTPQMVDAIAAERAKGRMLLIGTTNLDAQRQVVWDIGRIAASGQPDRVRLIRQILLASASIPGAFPPVEIDVTIDGKPYQEMHVDGGVTRGVFAFPPGFALPHGSGPRNLWTIRNNKLAPEYAAVGQNALAISATSVGTLIKSQARGDIQAMRAQARAEGFTFHLAAVPPDFPRAPNTPFDTKYMRALFSTGQKQILSGQAWRKLPDQLMAPAVPRQPQPAAEG
ncbi:patatin-like phospholipase family protein [Paracoccus pacificus]|uniref:Patatin-like phospholipase family protein n=1 Tax=Paracoccus pacificus TaxID=1463598 RepID=A0ABW4R935_9RHOB